MIETEHPEKFEQRKRDHIQLSLDPANEAKGDTGLDQIQLIHEALPDIDFNDVDIRTSTLGHQVSTPFLVSSMTAGHVGAVDLNCRLAKACASHDWLMGVGSQRRELQDPKAQQEWKAVRQAAPNVKLLGNIGLSQLIHSKADDIRRLVDVLEALAMIVHLNPLQECLQPEGTPYFKGGLERISKLCLELNVPVIVKETGCGFSQSTARRLQETGIAALDISGYGGTHWGRIEGHRAPDDSVQSLAAAHFATWGISSVQSLANALSVNPPFEVWASGGVRSGVDAAKFLAMGASLVGVAKPILAAALQGEEVLDRRLQAFEFELKTAMFCTGSQNLAQLTEKKVQRWQQR